MPHNVVVFPTTPIQERQRHDPIDLALRDLHIAGADFMQAILQTEDRLECLRLHQQLSSAILVLEAIASSALERASIF